MKRCVSTFKFNFTLILFIVIRCSLSFAIVFFGFTQFSLLGHRFVPCVPFLAFISSSFFLNYFSFHFISVVCLFIFVPVILSVYHWQCVFAVQFEYVAIFIAFSFFFSSMCNTFDRNQENKQKQRVFSC